jgi:hypothetical protein
MLHSPLFTRSSAALLSLLLVPAAQAVPAPRQTAAASSQAQETQTAEAQPHVSALPDAPSPQEPSQNSEQNNSQASSKQQNSSTSPVGTAAAPAEEPVGAAGSRPAGAVIAPAKQRRVHTFLISAAIIAGAGIAIGTVVALSHASPSQPH